MINLVIPFGYIQSSGSHFLLYLFLFLLLLLLLRPEWVYVGVDVIRRRIMYVYYISISSLFFSTYFYNSLKPTRGRKERQRREEKRREREERNRVKRSAKKSEGILMNEWDSTITITTITIIII